jgi:hypothetical protein
LSEDGFHRTTAGPVHVEPNPVSPAAPVSPVQAAPVQTTPVQAQPVQNATVQPAPASVESVQAGSRGEYVLTEADSTGEPVLSAEELRALLQEQPSVPPGNEPRK